jgi:hypothetical protein
MDGFDWDDANRDHLRRHGVEPEDAEDALQDPDALAVEAYNAPTEKRWATLGATESGRLLFVLFTTRRKLFRVIMARDAKPTEKRRYRKANA